VNISYMSVPSTTLSPNPWARILDALEKKINRHSYDTWLKPTRYSHSSGGILFVRVPTVEFRHAGDKYADLIQEAIDNLGLGFNDVKFVTPEDDPAANSRPPRRRPHRRANDRGPVAVPLRLGRRRAAQPALHLRRLRHRQRQPVRARRLPGRRRATVKGLQPALPLRRRRHGQDSPHAGHRTRDQAPPAANRHLLHLQREVHQRHDQLAALRQDDDVPRQVPQRRRPPHRRHPVPHRQRAHPGRIFPHLQRPARVDEADRHRQRPLAQRTRRDRRPPAQPLRVGTDRRHPAARSRNQSRDSCRRKPSRKK
jgi:hypothetical protein